MTKAASGYWDMFDPTNGFTAIHARTLGVMDLENVARRWFFETSMLIELVSSARWCETCTSCEIRLRRSSLSEVRCTPSLGAGSVTLSP